MSPLTCTDTRASDRCCPLITVANGTLMAQPGQRGPCAALAVDRILTTSISLKVIGLPADVALSVHVTDHPATSACVAVTVAVTEAGVWYAPSVPEGMNMSSAIHAMGEWLALAAFTFVYFLPFLIAYWRRRPNRWTVLLVNLVLGASGIGWIVALLMATRVHRRDRAPVR